MPYHHSSWEVPSMIYNSLDMSNKEDPHAAEARQTFGNFVTKVIERAVNSTLINKQNGQLEILDDSTNPPVKKPVPGTFFLPMGYKGTGNDFAIPFDVFYCDLALKIKEEMAKDTNTLTYLIELWKNATISMDDFNMESLLEHFGIQISPESFTFFSFFQIGECEVDYDVVMDFLAKVFLMDLNGVFFRKFGTTMEQLVDEGKLWIMSHAAGRHLTTGPFGEESLVSLLDCISIKPKIITSCWNFQNLLSDM